MNKTDLDNEIIEVREAYESLKKSGYYSAAKLAQADLSYLLSLLSN